MAYNEDLAERLRKALPRFAQEKKMFGGIGFLVDGNMTVGVYKEYLIVRTGKERHAAALKMKGAKPFDITGKPMTGWLMVSQEGCKTKPQLEKWISIAMEYVATLPPK